MESVQLTAKIQILVTSEEEKSLLNDTMSAYTAACNEVSDYIYRTHDLVQASLNKALYAGLRNRYGLRSQMAQSVLKTVIAKYKAILKSQDRWIRPEFKKPQYDLVWNRDYSLTDGCFSVNTLQGRVKLPYYEQGMSKYFDHDIYRFGTAKLVWKHGKYFLHVPVACSVESCSRDDICQIVGIDRGINFLVTTYDSKQKTWFVSGKVVKQKRAHYQKLRKELQMRRTPSARRRLKAIGSRENRWIQDVNHQVSKALVERNPEHTLFVLEDLTGIRSATERVALKHRYVSVSWAFYDLEQKLCYKAKLHHCTVLKVNPQYTSQCCPMCGHIEAANRNKKMHIFCCKKCGYRSNDDRIGAMNLYRMGIRYRIDGQVPDIVPAE